MTATVGNVVSRRVTIYYMTYDADAIPTDIKNAITDKFCGTATIATDT